MNWIETWAVVATLDDSLQFKQKNEEKWSWADDYLCRHLLMHVWVK